MIVSFFQIMALMISPMMKLPFKGALYNEVSTVFDLIRIYPLVYRLNSAHTYWFFLFKFCATIIIYYALLIFIDYTIRRKKM